MSGDETAREEHEAYEALLTDYVDGSLAEGERPRIEAHLEECAACREALGELKEAVSALSGLHRMSAPQHFEGNLERTIERRSSGRFFGRRAFGDRIPFEVLALVALLLAIGLFLLLRFSGTGTLDLGGEPDAPEMHNEARELVPRL